MPSGFALSANAPIRASESPSVAGGTMAAGECLTPRQAAARHPTGSWNSQIAYQEAGGIGRAPGFEVVDPPKQEER